MDLVHSFKKYLVIFIYLNHPKPNANPILSIFNFKFIFLCEYICIEPKKKIKKMSLKRAVIDFLHHTLLLKTRV